MANPTGSTYLQANTGYTWTDGDIYEIVQTDQVEGGTPGVTTGVGAASFLGLGVENQPHQVLLNKIQYTHTHQLADEVNISNLLAFKSLFASSVGPSGYMKLGAQDVNRGQIDIIFQWGTISTMGLPPSTVSFTFNFPLAFPNAIWLLEPWATVNFGAGISFFGLVRTIHALAKQTNTLTIQIVPNTASYLYASSPTAVGITGIAWWALGY